LSSTRCYEGVKVIKLQSFNSKTPFLSIWAIQAVVIRVTHIHFLEKDLLGYECNEYGVASLHTDCGQLISTLSSMETGLTELLKYDLNKAWEGFIDNSQGFIASRKR